MKSPYTKYIFIGLSPIAFFILMCGTIIILRLSGANEDDIKLFIVTFPMIILLGVILIAIFWDRSEIEDYKKYKKQIRRAKTDYEKEFAKIKKELSLNNELVANWNVGMIFSCGLLSLYRLKNIKWLFPKWKIPRRKYPIEPIRSKFYYL